MLEITKFKIEHFTTNAANKEAAEALVRNCWPELRAVYYAVREHMRAAESLNQAAGLRKQSANELTKEKRRAKAETVMRYNAAGQEVPPDILAALNDDISQAEESEAAADVEVKRVGELMGKAQYVFNMMTNTLAGWWNNGVRFRQRRVKVRSGDPSKALSEVVAQLLDLLAETERVRNAPPTISYLKQGLLAALDALLAEDAYKLTYADGEAVWQHPVNALEAEHVLPGRVVTTLNLLPLIMDLAGDDICERLMERVDRDHHGDTRLRLDPEEKAKRLKKLRSEILDLQREQAALIVLIAGNSPELAFPPGMAVEAMLGLETY